MPNTVIYEGPDSAFEVVIWTDPANPERHLVRFRQLSGPQRSPEQWREALEQFVRGVIDAGGQVRSVRYGVAGPEDER